MSKFLLSILIVISLVGLKSFAEESPSVLDLKKFSEDEMIECMRLINICNPNNDEYSFQWGRFSAFYDVIRYIDSGTPISYVSDPTRRD